MSTNTQGLLNQCPAVAACLCREAGVHSDHVMSGTFSLGFKDCKELTPCGIQDGLRHMVVLDHGGDSKVFDGNMVIVLGVLLCDLEMVISPLTVDLEMGLRGTLSSLALAVRAFLTTAHATLLAPQGTLRGAIEARVRNGVALTIGQERFQSDINANVSMSTRGWSMCSLRLCLTDNEGIPMPISSQDKVNGFRLPLDRTMQFDLEEVSHFLGNNEVCLVFMQIAIFAVLSQWDGVPPVRLLETRETHVRDGVLLGSQKPFEGFGEPICKHLDCCGRDMFTLPFESSFQVILARECPILLILCLDGLKHSIIQVTRFDQARQKQARLCCM